MGPDAGVVQAPDAGAPPWQPEAPVDGGELPWPRVPARAGLDGRPAAAALTLPGTLEVSAPGWIAEEAFPALRFDDPVALLEAKGTGHLFVAEREGRLYAFENDPGASEKQLVLDLSDRTQGENDSGLLGLVFHPAFGEPGSPNAAYVYVHYAFRADPIIGSVPTQSTPTVSRLARFTMDLETRVIDPQSELVLIDQRDENLYHQGGALFFHPGDGFLYIAVGDEGASNCSLGNCQIIDKDLFSGVLRIDVDMRGGDISHPIVKQPATGATANYFIPNDNPFVGRPGVLEEFYALGLRSPHRMTYDGVDDIAWIGEVGQARREELNVLRKAANYQWNALEGTLEGSGDLPPEPLGTWTDPVLELERDEAASIIGGYVYRGARHPSLYGKYIFGDFVQGNIWALTYAYDGEQATVLERELLVQTSLRNRADGITSFGVDQQNELYFFGLGSAARIWRLGRTEGFSNVPRKLSELGVFVDTASAELRISPGFVPYEVQSPLWSDGADKQRWVSVPDGATVELTEDRSWRLPPGSVLVKHFELALDESRPDQQKRRLETRLLVHGDDGAYYGMTYKWNAAGSDAELLLESEAEPIEVKAAGGQERHLRYFFPAPGDCAVCHNAAAGSVLGLRTSQLNGEMLYPATGRTANQIYTWGKVGLLNVALREAELDARVALTPIGDEAASLEDRVRSYWASNCSMCHGSVPDIRANWDARYEVPLSEQGVLLGPSESATDADVVLVAPGEPERSLLLLRSRSTSAGVAMPPLGRSVPDPTYVSVLERWIASLPREPEPSSVP